jgi:predicted alpha/beta-fold hydrolase
LKAAAQVAGKRFNASWWLPERHSQTLWPALTRRVRLDARPEQLELPDGDCVYLDWLGSQKKQNDPPPHQLALRPLPVT